MTPARLVAEARRLVNTASGDATGALRVRAATILTRQALEGRLEELLTARVTEIAGVAFDARLLVLRTVMGEPEAAAETRYVWAALSSASHLHAYELPPSRDELVHWIEAVERFLAASQRLCNQ
jgi:hypothetical protein